MHYHLVWICRWQFAAIYFTVLYCTLLYCTALYCITGAAILRSCAVYGKCKKNKLKIAINWIITIKNIISFIQSQFVSIKWLLHMQCFSIEFNTIEMEQNKEKKKHFLCAFPLNLAIHRALIEISLSKWLTSFFCSLIFIMTGVFPIGRRSN